MKTLSFKHSYLTNRIIKCFYKVYNTLGYGFLEKVYENAMSVEFNNLGINHFKQYPIDVYYETNKVGNYYADMVVENKIIIELKAAESICEEHAAQLTNYLKATDIEVGLLLNFGKEPLVMRRVFSNQYQNHNKS